MPARPRLRALILALTLFADYTTTVTTAPLLTNEAEVEVEVEVKVEVEVSAVTGSAGAAAAAEPDAVVIRAPPLTKIDLALVINLARRPDRLEAFKSRAFDFYWERTDAVDGHAFQTMALAGDAERAQLLEILSPFRTNSKHDELTGGRGSEWLAGYLGAGLSHLTAWERALAEGSEVTAIFEDGTWCSGVAPTGS